MKNTTKLNYDQWVEQAIAGAISDEFNPAMIFDTTKTELLIKLYMGELDVRELMAIELKSRGITI